MKDNIYNGLKDFYLRGIQERERILTPLLTELAILKASKMEQEDLYNFVNKIEQIVELV